jgi:hypothetical protein
MAFLSSLATRILGWLGMILVNVILGALTKLATALIERWKSNKRVKDADEAAEKKAEESKAQMAKAQTSDEVDQAARDSLR